MQTSFPVPPQYGLTRLICLILKGNQVSWKFTPTSLLSSIYAQAHDFPYCSVLKCQKYVSPLPGGKGFLRNENCTYRKLIAVNFFRFRRRKPLLYKWMKFPKKLHFIYWWHAINQIFTNRKLGQNYHFWKAISLLRILEKTGSTPANRIFFNNRFWLLQQEGNEPSLGK